MITDNKSIIEALNHRGVVVAERAAASELRLIHAREQTLQGRAAWPTPRIETVESLLRRGFAELADTVGATTRVLTALEEWILWRRAAITLIEESANESLLSPDVDRIADALQRAARLLSDWGLRATDSAGESRESLWLRAAMRDVEAGAAALGAMARHELLDWLARHGAGDSLAEPLLPLLEPLPRTLHRTLFGRHAPAGDRQPRAQAAAETLITPQVCAALDPEQEWRLAAVWAREQLLADPSRRLRIIIPGVSTVRDRVARVFTEHLNPATAYTGRASSVFAIEAPETLSQRPWIHSALETCSVLLASTVSVERLARWWRDPFWGTPSASWRARYARELRRRPLLDLTAARWRSDVRATWAKRPDEASDACLSGLARADQIIKDFTPKEKRLPGEWAEVYSELLDAMSWPGKTQAEPAHGLRAELSAWQGLLDDFANLEQVLGPCDQATALTTLQSIASRQIFDRPMSDAPVHISADFNLVCGYDGIWVTGLRADAWPAVPRVDGYVSRQALRAAGMREVDSAGQVAKAQAQLLRWQCSTRELVLSWSVSEDESLYLPSPMLRPWLPNIDTTDEGAEPWLRVTRPPLESLAQTLVAQRPALEIWADDHGVPWPAAQSLPGGVWALVDQDRCPFAAYATRRLRSGDEEESALGIDARLRGQLLHRAFEILWKKLRNSDRLRARNPQQLEQIIEQAVEELDFSALATTASETLVTRLRERESARLRKIMADAMVIERERPQSFSVFLDEEKLTLKLGEAQLVMRVDRVDQLSDGSWLVIDYKTGTARTPKWAGEDFDAIQMWLYAEAVREHLHGELAGLAHFSLRSDAVGFLALARDTQVLPQATVVPDLESIRHEARARLESIAQAFLQGRAPVRPRARACDYCALPVLCRKAELLTPDIDSAEDFLSIIDGGGG